MTVIGFTGTRQALSHGQNVQLRTIFKNMFDKDPRTRFHHGDCVGADATAHQAAMWQGFWVVVHPPIKPDYRAWCIGDETWPEDDYHSRNRQIVLGADWLLAMPKDKSGEGGTWYTITYASDKIPTLIVYPDGESEARTV